MRSAWLKRAWSDDSSFLEQKSPATALGFLRLDLKDKGRRGNLALEWVTEQGGYESLLLLAPIFCRYLSKESTFPEELSQANSKKRAGIALAKPQNMANL